MSAQAVAPRKRGRKKLNRSKAIRDYKTIHPAATPKEIVSALKARRISVTPGLVGVVIYGMKDKPNGAKRVTRGAKRVVRGRRPTRGASGLSAEDLVEAKKLVDEFGGIDEARCALDLLAQMA